MLQFVHQDALVQLHAAAPLSHRVLQLTKDSSKHDMVMRSTCGRRSCPAVCILRLFRTRVINVQSPALSIEAARSFLKLGCSFACDVDGAPCLHPSGCAAGGQPRAQTHGCVVTFCDRVAIYGMLGLQELSGFRRVSVDCHAHDQGTTVTVTQ